MCGNGNGGGGGHKPPPKPKCDAKCQAEKKRLQDIAKIVVDVPVPRRQCSMLDERRGCTRACARQVARRVRRGRAHHRGWPVPDSGRHQGSIGRYAPVVPSSTVTDTHRHLAPASRRRATRRARRSSGRLTRDGDATRHLGRRRLPRLRSHTDREWGEQSLNMRLMTPQWGDGDRAGFELTTEAILSSQVPGGIADRAARSLLTRRLPHLDTWPGRCPFG